MNTRYATARSIMGFIIIVGWIAFGLGIVAILFSFSEGSGPGAIFLPTGILASISGLIQVAIAQVSVAVLDMADNSRGSLEIQRKMAEAAGVSISPSANARSSAAKTEVSDEDPNVRIFQGERIEKIDNRYHWNNGIYTTLGKAKSAIKAAGV